MAIAGFHVDSDQGFCIFCFLNVPADIADFRREKVPQIPQIYAKKDQR